MVKRLLFFLCLFVSSLSYAQVEGDSAIAKTDTVILDTFDFDLKKFTGKGELTFVSQKSKTTGGVYQTSLRTGVWKFEDDKEVLRIEGSFKVKDNESVKTGKWSYYSDEGELMMIRDESSAKSPPVLYKPFVMIIQDGFEVINFNKAGKLELTQVIIPKETTDGEEGLLVYDTLVAMDKRNPDAWLVPKKIATPIKENENLVPNPSFEKNDGKVYHRGEVRNHIPDWKVSGGTPDYYRIKKLNTVDGYAMLGCRFYTEQYNDIEFISAALKETLEQDKVYCFRVYLRLRETSIYGVNAFGVLFSSKIPKADELIYGEVKPSLKHNGGASLAFKTQWMELSCTYKAKGDEEFITLGSFANADSMNKSKQKGEIFEAYYYFDMVQLYPLEKGKECPCGIGSKEAPVTPEPQEPELTETKEPENSKTFIIKNIFFKNDKWDLLPASFVALDSLFDVIDENDFKRIEISGHTSNTGSRERNLLLSKNRAEAVKKYLVKKGLPADMFECKGYGPDRPIADNQTDEGQAENRRVEFTILE